MKKQMKAGSDEPDAKKFEMPSEGTHSFLVVDANPDKVNADLILVKLEVCDGPEFGRSILHRVNLDESWKGFFLTRLFLKAIGEPYKSDFAVDTDMWIGKSFCAKIVHNPSKDGTKVYANIDKFDFDTIAKVGQPTKSEPKEVSWEE